MKCICAILGLIFLIAGLGAIAASQIIPGLIFGVFSVIVKGLTVIVQNPSSATQMTAWADAYKSSSGSATEYWLQNVTNLNQVMTQGAVPIIEDVGPYVFSSWTHKYDTASDLAGKTITYRDYSWYAYNDTLSCAQADTPGTCKDLTDSITLVNPAYAGLMGKIKNLLGGNDALLTSLINGKVFEGLTTAKVDSLLATLVGTVFFPTIYPNYIVNNQATALVTIPVTNIAGGSITQTSMDSYIGNPRVMQRGGKTNCQFTGHQSLNANVKALLYTAGTGVATSIRNPSGLGPVWVALSQFYIGAFNTVYAATLAAQGGNKDNTCAAMQANVGGVMTAVATNTPSFTAPGTTTAYTVNGLIATINAAAGNPGTGALSAGNIYGLMQALQEEIVYNGFPNTWNRKLAMPGTAPASATKAWFSAHVQTSSILGTGANEKLIAGELWALDNPLATTNPSSFMFNATGEATKLYGIVNTILGIKATQGTVAPTSTGVSAIVTWIQTNSALFTNLKGIVRWYTGAIIGGMAQILLERAPTTQEGAILNTLQGAMTLAAVTDFNTYTGANPAMSAQVAGALMTAIGGSKMLAASNGADVDLLKTFSASPCTYVPTQISDTASLQFACGQVVGAVAPTATASVNVINAALGTMVPEWYDITGFSFTGTTILPPTGSGLSSQTLTARQQYNRLLNFMLNGTITPMTYSILNGVQAGAGTKLQGIVASLNTLIGTTQPLLANQMGMVTYAFTMASVCGSVVQALGATAGNVVCGQLTQDMGGMTATQALLFSTKLVDVNAANAVAAINQGNGGPYITTTARKLFVDGFPDNTISYLRPFLPVSLGIPDAPAGPHILGGNRKDAAFTVLQSAYNATTEAEEKARLSQEVCQKGTSHTTAAYVKYGGNQGLHTVYNKPYTKFMQLAKRDGSKYAGRGKCVGTNWDASVNWWGHSVDIDGLYQTTMGPNLELVKSEWPKKADTTLATETNFWFSYIARPATLKFRGNGKDIHGKVDVRKFGLEPVTSQGNLSQADLDLHACNATHKGCVKCLWDITESSSQGLQILFGNPHMTGCAKADTDQSTIYRAPIYKGGAKHHNSTFDVEPITGFFFGLDAKVGVYFTVDPIDYSSFHYGLCNNSAWPVRTTAAGCTQSKKQIVPYFWARAQQQPSLAQSVLLSGAIQLVKMLLSYPTLLLGAGAGITVVSLLMLYYGCSKSSDKVGAA